MSVPAADVELDLTVPGLFQRDDYYDMLARLRDEAPVFRSADGSWGLTRYDDVRAVSRDPGRFVSSRGVLVNDPLRSDGTGGATMFSILHLDPPVHAVYRRVINREFTPRAVQPMEELIRAATRRLLDAASTTAADSPDGIVDLVDAVAAPVPLAVIADLLGVADGDLDLFRRWSDAVIASSDLAADDRAEQMAAITTGEVVDLLLEHVDSPAAEANDVLSLLKRADLDGRPLSRAEIMGFCMTLLIAGNETTRSLISGGAEVLARHPDQRAELAADTSLIPAAVEEMLRWVTPIQAFGRTAAVDVEIGGQAVGAGEFVVMLYASANRDEAAFGSTADRFDIHRDVSPTHVAFGFGEHLCLGASLARLEATVVFEELLARFPRYELAGPAELVPSTLTRALRTLAVALTPS